MKKFIEILISLFLACSFTSCAAIPEMGQVFGARNNIVAYMIKECLLAKPDTAMLMNESGNAIAFFGLVKDVGWVQTVISFKGYECPSTICGNALAKEDARAFMDYLSMSNWKHVGLSDIPIAVRVAIASSSWLRYFSGIYPFLLTIPIGNIYVIPQVES